MFGDVDWTHRGASMHEQHGISVEVANDALDDVNRVVITPDDNSTTGCSSRVIGFSARARAIVTVIVLADEGIEYGVNGWLAHRERLNRYPPDRRQSPCVWAAPGGVECTAPTSS